MSPSTVLRKLAQPRIVLVLAAVAGLQLPCLANPTLYESDDKERALAATAAWKAAQRLDHADAYVSFLARHPNSRYESEATASLDRIRQREAAFAAHPYNSFARPERLKELAALEGGSVLPGLPLGTRLLGPGVVVAGPLMERRHILLPFGEWIALASQNHETSSFPVLRLSSVAFGKFSGNELIELMLVTFNREPTPIANLTSSVAVSPPAWPALVQCGAAKDQSEYHLKDSDMRSRWCSTIVSKGVSLDTLQPSTLLTRARTALSALDVKLTEFGHQSETHVTLQSSHFISYTHLYSAALARIILVPVMEESDVSLSPKLDPATRWAYLQQAHFAYHAAIAYGQYYKQLALQAATRLNGPAVVQTLGRSP